MNGITSWSDLIVKRIVKYGRMKKTFCSFVIGSPYEDKRSAGLVFDLSSSSPSSFISGTNCFDVAVRGMMYYRRALKLQAFLDMANETGKTKSMVPFSPLMFN